MLQATTSGTRPQPNFGTPKDDVVVRAESGSTDKEHVHPENVHEHLESENGGWKTRTTESLPMTRTTTSNAFEGRTA
jgi:hypothetical protein